MDKGRHGGAADPNSTPRTSSDYPATATGWWALGLAAATPVVFMGVLPVITALFAESVPFTNSGWMPAIGTVFAWIALLFNTYAVWLKKERAPLSVAALACLVAFTAFVTFMVVGEGLGPLLAK